MQARNFKDVAPQKQNTICKTREQYAKCKCAFELFKAPCATTVNAKNASFYKKISKCKQRKLNFLSKKVTSYMTLKFAGFETRYPDNQELDLATTL